MLTVVDESSPQDKHGKAVKAISFQYSASSELTSLFEDFRLMCNDAIRIAIKERPKSRFNLIALAYPRLKLYGVHTHYILTACEVGFAVYKNKKRKSVPYVTKAFLKLDSQSYRLDHLLLRIPVAPRHFIFLTLQGSDYHLSFIDDPSLKKGSITITQHSVTIAFYKEVWQSAPVGYLGVDINEKNVTISATSGYQDRLTELGDIVELKER